MPSTGSLATTTSRELGGRSSGRINENGFLV